jgi:hypothetical protein
MSTFSKKRHNVYIHFWLVTCSAQNVNISKCQLHMYVHILLALQAWQPTTADILKVRLGHVRVDYCWPFYTWTKWHVDLAIKLAPITMKALSDDYRSKSFSRRMSDLPQALSFVKISSRFYEKTAVRLSNQNRWSPRLQLGLISFSVPAYSTTWEKVA